LPDLPNLKELHFLLDSSGALIVFEEKDTAWAGVLAFSSEESARDFCRISKIEVAELASIETADRDSIAALIREVKRRAVRYILLDLDYQSGRCVQVEFEGDALGSSREKQFSPREHR
jgi:hypothetical protein